MKIMNMTLLAALALALPAIAAEPAKPEAREKKVIKIVKLGDGAVSISDAGAEAAMVKCEKDGRRIETSSESNGKDGKAEKTRVVVCSVADADQARLRSALESARASLASLGELSPETKATALAGIDEQLNRLKSQAQPAK